MALSGVEYSERAESKVKKMVEVVIGGVQKCGTTALHRYLTRHPQIVGGSKKELHFFDDPTVDWSNPDYAPYEAMFPEPSLGQMRLEASPSYLYLPHCLERLADYNPDVYLIFIFRDPIERAWSHWTMTTHRGFEDLDFDEAVRGERARLAVYDAGDIGYKRYAYVSRGFYGYQFERALNLFPREQLLCLDSDSLKADPDAVLDRVASFLGIKPFEATTPIIANKGLGKCLTMTHATRNYICNTLRDDIRRFSALSGLETRQWGIFQDEGRWHA